MSEKRWKTKAGVVVIERGRRVEFGSRWAGYKIKAYRETGGFFGWLWLHNLTPVQS